MIVDFQHRKNHPKTMQSGLPDASHVLLASGSPSKTNNEAWVSQHLQTQLQFNRNIPTLSSNLAVRYSSPNPIVIEKLRQTHGHTQEEVDADGRSSNNSTPFSVVSEERLNLAIQLAKRDVKRKNLEEKVKEHLAKEEQNKPHQNRKHEQGNTKKLDNAADRSKSKAHVRFRRGQHIDQPPKADITSSGAKVYVYTPNRENLQCENLDSPPTHDPGPGLKAGPKPEADGSGQEVRRLQKELSKYIRKIEDLAKKDRPEDILDPDEERRGRIRRQEQSARSARMLYVLQQQVKEIQEELEELSPRKIKHTKKSRTMSRLAAVHRGAIRALQMFVTQLTDQAEHRFPAHHKELGHLIRQLSLCSAKLEEKADSSLSDTIISILQQVEDLDSLMEKKGTPQKMKKPPSRPRSKSSSSREVSPSRQRSVSPRKVKKPPPVSKEHVVMEQKWPPVVRKLLNDEIQPATGFPVTQDQGAGAGTNMDKKQAEDISSLNRNAILKAGIATLIQEEHLKKRPLSETGPFKTRGVLVPERPQGFRQPRKMRPSQPTTRNAHFQAKTLAFRLKETQAPAREAKTPWIPPNPTSPPASPRRVNWGKQLHYPKECSGKDQVVPPSRTEEERLAAVEEEAVRLAWLDSMTSRTMRELNLIRKEEMDRIRRLRSDATDSTRLPADDRLKAPVNKAEAAAESADVLSEKLLDEVLDDTALELWNMQRDESMQSEAVAMQDRSSLEIMMQRMEEMERYQDSVRRRFNQIVYTDPEFWAMEEKQGRESASVDRKPVSPHPIMITRTVGHTDPQVDIILEKPLDATDGSMEVEEKSEMGGDILHPLAQKMSWPSEGCTFLSVPRQMLQSVHDYKDRYERHLKLLSHEAVGSFNPWHITESLADELIEDALDEVAAELQDVCEDYAEAVFTSEFLQPAE